MNPVAKFWAIVTLVLALLTTRPVLKTEEPQYEHEKIHPAYVTQGTQEDWEEFWNDTIGRVHW